MLVRQLGALLETQVCSSCSSHQETVLIRESDAGAAGGSTGAISISRGGIIAIIVIASSVCIFGGKDLSPS